MNKFHLIIIVLFLNTIYSRQIGFISNHIFTYQLSAKNSSITTITFDNAASCNACVCAAFMSTVSYIAINCYHEINTCILFKSSVIMAGIIHSDNSSVYILSNISTGVLPTDDLANSSSVTTTIEINPSVDSITDDSTAPTPTIHGSGVITTTIAAPYMSEIVRPIGRRTPDITSQTCRMLFFGICFDN